MNNTIEQHKTGGIILPGQDKGEAMISVKNLSKHFKVLNRREGLGGAVKDLFSRDYSTVKAVDDISMEIEEGEIIGFIGPNGAGKSTTIKMLIGVLQPTAGEISVKGFAPYKERRQYVKHIGVVMGQRTQLWWDLPVIESFKLLRDIYDVPKGDYEENLQLFSELVGLDKQFMKPVRTLSLGQRMLCDLAASFLHNPPVIFLDEPTIGLDVGIKYKLRKIIKDLNKLKKTTILLTTHDVGDIEELSKRIILIDKGNILYDGSLERFNTSFGAYRTLRLDLSSHTDLNHDLLRSRLTTEFTHVDNIAEGENGWFDITIDQDKVPMLDMLNHLMKQYNVRDLKIEEIKMEQVIQKVYDGALG